MWTKARLAGYIGVVFAGLAIIAAALGAGTYDLETGMFDLHPFNVYWFAGLIAGPISAAVAAVAVLFKWGPK